MRGPLSGVEIHYPTARELAEAESHREIALATRTFVEMLRRNSWQRRQGVSPEGSESA